jgi:proton-dependent oligopeptide transporter, POT family
MMERQHPITGFLTEQPKGLWAIAVIIMLFCFGFSAINSLLVLIATEKLHMSTSASFTLSAAYNSLLYTLPLFGGYLGEQFGYFRALALGSLLSCIALILLSFSTVTTFYLGLAFFATAAAFFVPSYYVVQGKLYAKDDTRRESGFTISYLILNVGFLGGAAISGYLVKDFNYSVCFLVSAVVAFICTLVFFSAKHHLVPHKGRIITPNFSGKAITAWAYLLISTALIIVLAQYLIRYPKADDALLFVFIAATTVYIIKLARGQESKKARQKLYALLLLAYISVGFWALYMLEPSLITIFIKTNVDRVLLGHIIPPSVFFALDPLFIIVLGGILSLTWAHLAKRKKNPSYPTKFSASLLIMGLAFMVLVIGTLFSDSLGLCNMLWVILAYIMFTTAELFISPIGSAMVGQLAPEGREGRLMGAWQLFTGFAAVIAGFLAQFADTPKHMPPDLAAPIYITAFAKIGGLTLILGIIAWILTPAIKRLLNPN